METQVEIIGTIITISSTIILALAGTIGILFYRLEKKNDTMMEEKKKDNTVIIELTKSFIETTIGVKTTLDNNTKVIEKVVDKLPEAMAMQIKAGK